jgi:AcrR family transcriptional regulator
MARMKAPQAQRCRGRPRRRSDDETRRLIFDVARHAFAAHGYAATSMEVVARGAGVSTKTLYRLVPNKAALFEDMIKQRLEGFLSDVSLHAGDHNDIEQALREALTACAELVLDPEVVALQRMMLQDSALTEMAETFYRQGIVRTQTALADWLRIQQRRGLIAIDDAQEVAGILIGMVTSVPQRAAIFGGVTLPSRARMQARIRTCAALFLRGCATGR